MQYPLRIGTNNVQTDSLKAHEASEISEGHTVRHLFGSYVRVNKYYGCVY